MSGRIRNSCVILTLSLALLYAGVAWAMEWCLRFDGHPEHFTVEDHHQTQAASDFDHHQSVPVIHCPSPIREAGPAVRVASTEIRHRDSGVPLHAAFSTDALARVVRNDLWLEALFKRIVTFSLPVDLARHLFLSVLRI